MMLVCGGLMLGLLILLIGGALYFRRRSLRF
jgi:hypothetical protein